MSVGIGTDVFVAVGLGVTGVLVDVGVTGAEVAVGEPAPTEDVAVGTTVPVGSGVCDATVVGVLEGVLTPVDELVGETVGVAVELAAVVVVEQGEEVGVGTSVMTDEPLALSARRSGTNSL